MSNKIKLIIFWTVFSLSSYPIAVLECNFLTTTIVYQVIWLIGFLCIIGYHAVD